VWRETGRGKIRFKIRDLFVDGWRTRPILDFLRTTDMGCRMQLDGPKEEAWSEEPEREEGEEQETGVAFLYLSLGFPLSFLMSLERGMGQAGAEGVAAIRL